MSGNVGQYIEREEKKEDFRIFILEFRDIPLETAIAEFYPRVIRNSNKYVRLMKFGTLQRQNNPK